MIAKIAAIALGIIIVALLVVLIFVPPVKSPTIPLPQPAMSSDGRVEVDLPHADDVVSSPVAIEGNVTGGGWFYEAAFPIKVLDGAGQVLGTGRAQALSDWTSTGTVPFSASILFTARPGDTTGTIVFSKDNPSGLPANAESFSVPVRL